jgi:hypothetical protein
VEVDGGAWSSLGGSDAGNSPAGATSHESRPPRLLAGASIVEAAAASQLDGGGCGERAGRGEEAARWRRTRQTGPGGKCGAEEAARDGARRCGDRWQRGGVGWADEHGDIGRK